jgi:hypothetical protein
MAKGQSKPQPQKSSSGAPANCARCGVLLQVAAARRADSKPFRRAAVPEGVCPDCVMTEFLFAAANGINQSGQQLTVMAGSGQALEKRGSSPCDTCAFGKTGAALEPHNRLRASICALGPFPFSCHHARDGREIDWRDRLSSPAARDLRICVGWQREVARRAKLGYFKGPYREIRRAVAYAALQEVYAFTNQNVRAQDHRDPEGRLRRILRFLSKRDIGPLKIPL